MRCYNPKKKSRGSSSEGREQRAAMADETSETRKESRVAILELANMISVPMSLNAIVRLNVADAIWDSGSNAPLSASETLSRLKPQPTGKADPENLQRILRLLTTHNVFTEHITETDRKYSLTEVGKTLVSDGEGLSYGPYVLQHHQDALMKSWPLVHEAVLDPGTEPFVKANGGPAYDHYGDNAEMNELMQRAMAGVSVPFMKALLEGYDGFQGVATLVDVGGSGGECLGMILRKHPHVTRGINFDLPLVVAKAAPISGVTHIGGDMFKEIPAGDAVFMKWILTTWTDEECKVILKKCYEALPNRGKLIACEPVLPHDSDSSHRTRALLEGDIFVMTIYRAKGKHRTEEEFRQLGLCTGFTQFRSVHIDHFYTVLEFIK